MTFVLGMLIREHLMYLSCCCCTKKVVSCYNIETPVQEGRYPQYRECLDKPQISKRTANKNA